MSNFVVGDVARITTSIVNASGASVDPQSLALKVKKPDETIAIYTTEIIKDSVGNYHLDFPIFAQGSYFYRWEATGNNAGVGQGSFFAVATTF